MDLLGVILFGGLLIYNGKTFYEVWYKPQVFRNRIIQRRNSMKYSFGFSLGGSGEVNITSARLAATLMLIIYILGFLASLAGTGN